MGKHDMFSPKAIANRMKAKGLTKIRWYCQMCRKACRDANGFKCHCLSESHKRQMEIFGENSALFIDKFSDEFEAAFLNELGFSHPTAPVAAKVVYDEYISDRDHIHMNATRWATLTEFVTYLGRTGKCKVEDTPKGWFIEYIYDPKPTTYKRIKSMAPEEKQEKIIEKQIEKAKMSIPLPLPFSTPKEEVQELMALDKVAFKFDSSLPKPTTKKAEISSSNPFEQVEFDKKATTSRKPGGFCMSTTLDELIREEERAKDLKYRKDHWLREGIVVKVVSKALADKGYYNQKGVVMKVIDKYVGEIKMIESSHVLRVDQEELQTVIPNIGGMVKIVNGGYRGSGAKVLAVDERNYCAKVKIEKGLYDGRVIQDIDIEDISKLVM